MATQENKSGGFAQVLKNLFWLLLILQFAPGVISQLTSGISDALIAKDQVGYLSIKGLISDSAFYTKRIEEFEKNPNVKALMLKIDCPGGYPASSQAVFNELKRFKEKKPIVAYVENLGASGGYYIAAAADKIVANGSSTIGSIGVVGQVPNFKGLMDTLKVDLNYVQAGKYKTAGSPLKPIVKEEFDYLQSIAEDHYRQFINDIVASRKIEQKDYRKWADGKVFTGKQALQLKLIDKIGTYRDAVDELKDLANLKNDVKFVTMKKQPGGLMRLLVGDEEFAAESSEVFATRVANFFSSVWTKVMHHQQANNTPVMTS